MSYQIPQQIEYKEKIIFGLTFQQLIYAIIFSLPALAVLFKTPFSPWLRISLSLIPCGIAILFMFTQIPLAIKNWIKWQGWKECKLMDAKMKRYFGLIKIKGEVLYVQ